MGFAFGGDWIVCHKCQDVISELESETLILWLCYPRLNETHYATLSGPVTKGQAESAGISLGHEYLAFQERFTRRVSPCSDWFM